MMVAAVQHQGPPPNSGGITINAGVILAGLLVVLLGAIGGQVFYNATTLGRIDTKLDFFMGAQKDKMIDARKEVDRLEMHLNTIWPRLRRLEQAHNIMPQQGAEYLLPAK